MVPIYPVIELTMNEMEVHKCVFLHTRKDGQSPTLLVVLFVIFATSYNWAYEEIHILPFTEYRYLPNRFLTLKNKWLVQ